MPVIFEGFVFMECQVGFFAIVSKYNPHQILAQLNSINPSHKRHEVCGNLVFQKFESQTKFDLIKLVFTYDRYHTLCHEGVAQGAHYFQSLLEMDPV